MQKNYTKIAKTIAIEKHRAKRTNPQLTENRQSLHFGRTKNLSKTKANAAK
jgi:hypothetical protein